MMELQQTRENYKGMQKYQVLQGVLKIWGLFFVFLGVLGFFFFCGGGVQGNFHTFYFMF